MRRAVILCTGELLGNGLGPLFDAGVSVFGSFDSRNHPGCVVLGIEGDALPDECEPGLSALHEVIVEFTQESYGRQRLVRVSAIRAVPGRTVLDLSSPNTARAA